MDKDRRREIVLNLCEARAPQLRRIFLQYFREGRHEMIVERRFIDPSCSCGTRTAHLDVVFRREARGRQSIIHPDLLFPEGFAPPLIWKHIYIMTAKRKGTKSSHFATYSYCHLARANQKHLVHSFPRPGAKPLFSGRLPCGSVDLVRNTVSMKSPLLHAKHERISKNSEK